MKWARGTTENTEDHGKYGSRRLRRFFDLMDKAMAGFLAALGMTVFQPVFQKKEKNDDDC